MHSCRLPLFLSFALIALTACGDDDVCEAGATQRCVCPSGDGAQVCNDDGAAWGECVCGDFDAGPIGGDVGAGPDAAVDAMGGDAGASSCSDGIRNGQETGVDCGGPSCDACVQETVPVRWNTHGGLHIYGSATPGSHGNGDTGLRTQHWLRFRASRTGVITHVTGIAYRVGSGGESNDNGPLYSQGNGGVIRSKIVPELTPFPNHAPDLDQVLGWGDCVGGRDGQAPTHPSPFREGYGTWPGTFHTGDYPDHIKHDGPGNEWDYHPRVPIGPDGHQGELGVPVVAGQYYWLVMELVSDEYGYPNSEHWPGVNHHLEMVRMQMPDIPDVTPAQRDLAVDYPVIRSEDWQFWNDGSPENRYWFGGGFEYEDGYVHGNHRAGTTERTDNEQEASGANNIVRQLFTPDRAHTFDQFGVFVQKFSGTASMRVRVVNLDTSEALLDYEVPHTAFGTYMHNGTTQGNSKYCGRMSHADFPSPISVEAGVNYALEFSVAGGDAGTIYRFPQLYSKHHYEGYEHRPMSPYAHWDEGLPEFTTDGGATWNNWGYTTYGHLNFYLRRVLP